MEAERIRDVRRNARVSQTELGVALGRSQMYVVRLEHGIGRLDDEIVKRVLAEIERIATRKRAIEKAQREATARVVRDFENLDKTADVVR